MPDFSSPSALRLLAARHSIADLQAINTSILKSGAMVYVTAIRDVYSLLKESTQTPDGVNIVQSATGSAGRWFRMNVSQTTWQTQPDWYVDEQNATGLASDSNSGATAAQPLLTCSEFSRRTALAVLQQVTTMHLMSDASTSFMVPRGMAPGAQLTVIGEASQVLAQGTVTTSIGMNPSLGIRPLIEIPGVDFSSVLNKRGRIVSGVGVGAVFWIEAIGPESGQAYISQAAIPGAGSKRSVNVGDVIAIEELTSMGPVTGYGAVTQPFYYAQFRDIRTVPSQAGGPLPIFDINAQTSWAGCDIVAFRLTLEAAIDACRVDAFFLFPRPFIAIWSSSLQCPVNAYHGPGDYIVNNECTVPGHTINLEDGAQMVCTDPVGIFDWSGAGVDIEETSHMTFHRFWGTSQVAGSYGIRVRTNASAQYLGNAPPVAKGAEAHDVNIGGITDTYANLPAAGQDPGNNNAWLVASA